MNLRFSFALTPAFLVLTFFTSGRLLASNQTFVPCSQDPARLNQRSEELQEIVKADQADRVAPIDWSRVSPRDEARRKRVGEIFGEGCLHEAKDFAAAGLVFQHGNVPEHFFQTFLWAKRAVELGDPDQKWLMAAGIDRYLVNIGHKQLFATQASKPAVDACWCLQPVEPTFPIERRKEYAGKSIEDAMRWVDSLNAGNSHCSRAQFCVSALEDTPPGSVPGFW